MILSIPPLGNTLRLSAENTKLRNSAQESNLSCSPEGGEKLISLWTETELASSLGVYNLTGGHPRPVLLRSPDPRGVNDGYQGYHTPTRS